MLGCVKGKCLRSEGLVGWARRLRRAGLLIERRESDVALRFPAAKS